MVIIIKFIFNKHMEDDKGVQLMEKLNDSFGTDGSMKDAGFTARD